MATIWAERLSGRLLLHIPSRGVKLHQIQISSGGIVERDRFPLLNACLKRGSFRFTAEGLTLPADRSALGRFLYQQALHGVRQLPQPARSLPPHRPTCAAADLQQLFPDDDDFSTPEGQLEALDVSRQPATPTFSASARSASWA